MKLVELLARELKDWPKKYKYSVCDKDGEIRFIGHDTELDFYPSVPVRLEDRIRGYAGTSIPKLLFISIHSAGFMLE